MTRIAALDDYQGVALAMADWGRLQAQGEVVVFRRNLASEDEAASALAEFDVVCLMRERMPVPRSLLARLPRLKLIVVTGAHNRTLDLAAAKERGIAVAHTRGGDSQYATPELAWGLILSLMRHIPEEHQRMREGGWQETIGTALHGRTLSILGLGRLGTRMAMVGKAFGMEVLAWSPNLTAERAGAAGAALVSKEELFERADVLTIHLVLGERSRGLVGPAELARMLFAGADTAIPRVEYEGEAGSRFTGHKGFNWRRLQKTIERRFEVERRLFSPMPLLGAWMNSQVWFVCRKRSTA